MRRQVDGDKCICMDRIDRQSPCLIYSSGVNHDWTFEDIMDRMGCTVLAHDHTVDFPETRGRNIRFFKLGLGNENNMDTRVRPPQVDFVPPRLLYASNVPPKCFHQKS